MQWRYAPSLLSDPFRALRIEAVNLLANRSDAQGRSRPDAFDDAAREYVDSQRYSAELPEARANLGAFLARTGDVPRGAAELESAIALHPHFPRAYVDLADVQRAEGDESRAEATLRQGLSRLPRDATLHHALGLALVRMGRNDDAVTELAQAARLDPGNARFAYVYGVALHSQGSPAAAIDVLVDASRAHPADQALLEALAAFYRDAGDNAEAERFTERLRQLRR